MLRRIFRALRTPLGLVAAVIALSASIYIASVRPDAFQHTTLVGYALGHRPTPRPTLDCGFESTLDIMVYERNGVISVACNNWHTRIPNEFHDAYVAADEDPNGRTVTINGVMDFVLGPGLCLPWSLSLGADYGNANALPAESRDLLIRAAPQIEHELRRMRFDPPSPLPVLNLGRIMCRPQYLRNYIVADIAVATASLLTLIALTGIPTYTRQSRRARRLAKNLCPACGYNAQGLATCPECGTRTQHSGTT